MKAILVIDMPDKCFKCPIVDMTLHLCPILDKAILPETKPYSCPLKSMPKFRDEHYKSFNIELSQIINSENRGYNDCLREILGEEE